MSFRYIDKAGREIELKDLDSLARAIDRGDIAEDSLMFDRESGRWVVPPMHAAFRRLMNSRQPYPSIPRRSVPPQGSFAVEEPDASPGLESPDRQSPNPEPAGSLFDAGRNPMLAVQAMALAGAAIFAATGTMRNPDGDGFGFWLGLVVGAFLLSSVFLAWSRRTRRLIPFGMAASLLIYTMGPHAPRFQVDRPASDLDTALELLDWAERQSAVVPESPRPGFPAPSVSPQAPQETNIDQIEWLVARSMEVSLKVLDSLMTFHGMSFDGPPAWAEDDYLTSASRYPSVPHYLANSELFLRNAEQDWARLTLEQLDPYLQQVFPTGSARESFREGLADTMILQPLFDNQWALLDASKEFHEFLVRYEDLIRDDPITGDVTIDDDRVAARLDQIVTTLLDLTMETTRIQAESFARQREGLEEMRRSRH